MRQITFSRYAVSGHLSHGGDAHAHAQLVLGGESSVPERPAGGRERAPRDCRAPGPAPAITTVKFMGQVPSARHDTSPVPTGFLHDLQDPVGLLNEGHLHVPFEEKAALGLGGVAPAGGPGEEAPVDGQVTVVMSRAGRLTVDNPLRVNMLFFTSIGSVWARAGGGGDIPP